MQNHGLKNFLGKSRGITLQKVKLAAQSATEQRRYVNKYESGTIGSVYSSTNEYYTKLSKISGGGGSNIIQKISRWLEAFKFNVRELKDVSNSTSKNKLSTILDNILKKS